MHTFSAAAASSFLLEEVVARVVDPVLTDRFKPVFFAILKNRKPVIFPWKNRFFLSMEKPFSSLKESQNSSKFSNNLKFFFNLHLKTHKTIIKSEFFGFGKLLDFGSKYLQPTKICNFL